jgi:hypothetical protein
MALKALPLVAPLALAACSFAKPAVYGECSSDHDCKGGDVCARTGDCLAPTALAPPITVSWTFHGGPADAAWCAQYPTMTLQLTSDNGDPNLLVHDLPCMSSGVALDRIPIHLPYFALGIASAPLPARYPDPNWDSRYVAPGTTTVTFALEP